MSVHKYSNNFSSPCFSLPSKLFRTNSSFLLSPDFLDHAPRAETLNSRKYRMFIIIPSNHQNTSRKTIWLVNNTEPSLGHKTRLPCSFAKPFPWSSTNRPKFFKKETCFRHFPWISRHCWTIFIMKYPVLCACVHSLIQSSCLVCTVSVFIAWTQFNERAASMAKLHAPSAGDSFKSLEVEILANFPPIFVSTVC